MGRGAYDTTDPKRDKSAAARDVLQWEDANKQKREDTAAMKAAEEELEKLIRSKKSRGIMAARRAEKEGLRYEL